MNSGKIKDLLLLHEGYRQFPYKDSKGILTIGIGTNLESDGLTECQAWSIANDKVTCIKDSLLDQLPFFGGLNEVRQAVLIDIAYNCGVNGLMAFKRMLHAASLENYVKAGDEIEDSQLAPKRKERLAQMMRSGEWCENEL